MCQSLEIRDSNYFYSGFIKIYCLVLQRKIQIKMKWRNWLVFDENDIGHILTISTCRAAKTELSQELGDWGAEELRCWGAEELRSWGAP